MQKLMAALAAGAKPASRPQRPVPFGEWAPDQPGLDHPGCLIAKNVIPFGPRGYKPFKDFGAYSGALDARCQGAVAVAGTDGFTYPYAGDASKLYRLAETTWTDASKSGGYTCLSDEFWEFVAFGGYLIACNISDPVQGITPGATTFADQFTSTLKPKARHIARVNNFLVLGNVNESGTPYPERVRWGAIGSAVDMDPAAVNQSDAQDLGGNGGWIQKITSGDEGYIFRERTIEVMQYEGSPTVFRIRPVEENRGTVAPQSVIRLGRLHAFLAADGFFLFDGLESHPISDGKITRWFFDNVLTAYLFRTVGAIDFSNQMFVWAFPSTAASDGNPDTILMHHWPSGWWAYANVTVEYLFNDLSKGVTLDGLDSVSSSLDALPFSLDSRFWTGGVLQLGAFNSSHVLGAFNGSALAVQMDSGDRQLFPGQRGLVTKIIPLTDGGSPTIQMAARKTLQTAVSFGSAASMNADGYCPARGQGRYHRVRLNMPAGETWTHIQGFQPVGGGMGGR